MTQRNVDGAPTSLSGTVLWGRCCGDGVSGGQRARGRWLGCAQVWAGRKERVTRVESEWLVRRGQDPAAGWAASSCLNVRGRPPAPLPAQHLFTGVNHPSWGFNVRRIGSTCPRRTGRLHYAVLHFINQLKRLYYTLA